MPKIPSYLILPIAIGVIAIGFCLFVGYTHEPTKPIKCEEDYIYSRRDRACIPGYYPK